MATETLEDNKPPLPDKDEDAGIPKKEASAEAAKSEDANVDEKDGASNQEVEEDEVGEKKEIDEDEEDEKDDDGEEEEDEAVKTKAKGRNKESPKKSKKSKKEAASDKKKKDPATPASERPTRERKTVERYSVPSPAKSARSSASKGFTIEKGRGTQLKDIPNVAFKLSKRKPDDNLHMLHALLFGKKTKAHNLKRNIGQFSGYVWTENEDKQRAKVKERIDKFVKEKLLDFCDVLNIQINKANVKKEELSAKLLEFLESPHATTDILLADKEQKGKKRTRKATPSKSPGEASTETPAKKQKQTSQSGKKQKQSSDDDEDDKAELSDAKDDSQEDEDVAVPNNESDDEGNKSEEEEEKSKARKRTSKKNVKESSVSKAGDRTSSVKKSSAKDAKSIEKTKKNQLRKGVLLSMTVLLPPFPNQSNLHPRNRKL
ncbi:DEK protein [Spatholobus suberectus]|nr:DEK protein [Spatholobus suberectus]